MSEESRSWDNIHVNFITADGIRYNITKDSVTSTTKDLMQTKLQNRKIVYFSHGSDMAKKGLDRCMDTGFIITTVLDSRRELVIFTVNNGEQFVGSISPEIGSYPFEFNYYKNSNELITWIFREKIKSLKLE